MSDVQPQSLIPKDLEATLQRIAGLSPKTLLDVADDPGVLQANARVIAMLQLGVLNKMSASPSFTIQNRLQLLDKAIRLSGVNQVNNDAVTADKLPQITINIGNPHAAAPNPANNSLFPAKYSEKPQKEALEHGEIADFTDEEAA